MSNITLNLDADALREATVQAMVGVLTPEIQKKLVQQAVEAALKPSTDSWNRGKSPLQEAFDRAIVAVANAEAKRMVEEDPQMRDQIKVLMREVADKVLNADKDKLADRMASSFVDALRRD